MSEKYPPVLSACLSVGAVLVGMVGYLLMPPIAADVLTAAFAGPSPNPQAASLHPEVRRIQAAEAKELPNVLFVDVRSQGEYEAGHVKGALWIPMEQIRQHASELPRDRPIVLYCT